MSDLNPNQPGSNAEQEQIHKEGTDYIKDQINKNQISDDGTGKGTAPEPIDFQPPASNPGHADASGGIPKGAGGLSSTAPIGSPVPSEEKSSGIVDTVKGFLGLQSSQPEEKRAEDTDAQQARNVEEAATLTTASAVVAAAAVTASGNSDKSFTAELADRTRAAESEQGANTATGSTEADTAASAAIPTTSKMENTDNSKGRAGDTFDSGVSQKATDGQSGPGNTFDSGVSNTATDGQSGPGNTFDSGVTRTATDNQSGPGDTMDSGVNKNVGSEGHLEREASGEKGPKKEGAKKMENESAIPTAGGQRLGEEHWGESKIVPENPKPQESEGVSSGSGQPDDETAKNTAKNAGGHGSSGDGEGKQSMIDKIKDKLPIGGKNKD